MTFFEWLKTVEDENSPVGDFAKDTAKALKDTERFSLLPRNGDLDELEEYFNQFNGEKYWMIDAFQEAKKRFLDHIMSL